jgi:hypothetical protein
MRKSLYILLLLCAANAIHAQTRPPYIYTIKADSVLITNSCDTAELILENHTQNVPGFLFNKGGGRTEFRRPLQKISDTLYTVGIDSLKLPNAWVQGGNAWGTIGILGTKDNNDIAFYTNNTLRGYWTSTGNFIIGPAADNSKFQVNGYGGISVNPILSAPSDRIMFGGYANQGDDQNYLIRTSTDNGATYKNVLIERNGNVGLGVSNVPTGWVAGNPAVRVYADGRLSLYSQTIYFGNTVGPWNSSALLTSVSNVNEWATGQGNYPNKQNFYYIGTMLSGAEDTNVRAPLRLSAYHLDFYTGRTEVEAARISEGQNMLLGTTTDNGAKLQVNGKAYITDTLKLPNIISQTDTASYKPMTVDANGNVFKMSGWPASATRKSATVTGSSYTVPANVDVVFVNYASGQATITLPTGTSDREITIKNLSTANTVILSGIDSNESNSIATRGAITLKYTGSSWVGISKY